MGIPIKASTGLWKRRNRMAQSRTISPTMTMTYSETRSLRAALASSSVSRELRPPLLRVRLLLKPSRNRAQEPAFLAARLGVVAVHVQLDALARLPVVGHKRHDHDQRRDCCHGREDQLD